MDAQPKRRAGVDREQKAEVLREVLAESEHLLRRQARRHSELPEDAEDALQSALALFIERYRGDCDPLAWLQTTVKREAWALRRRSSRRARAQPRRRRRRRRRRAAMDRGAPQRSSYSRRARRARRGVGRAPGADRPPEARPAPRPGAARHRAELRGDLQRHWLDLHESGRPATAASFPVGNGESRYPAARRLRGIRRSADDRIQSGACAQQLLDVRSPGGSAPS
jgi:hypothetical protein